MNALLTTPEGRRRLLNISSGKRFATLASANDIMDMAHHCAVSSELLDDLRASAIAAKAQGRPLQPESVLAWLDQHTPQLNRATAQKDIQS